MSNDIDYEFEIRQNRNKKDNGMRFDDDRQNKKDWKQARRERRRNKSRDWLIDPD